MMKKGDINSTYSKKVKRLIELIEKNLDCLCDRLFTNNHGFNSNLIADVYHKVIEKLFPFFYQFISFTRVKSYWCNWMKFGQNFAESARYGKDFKMF